MYAVLSAKLPGMSLHVVGQADESSRKQRGCDSGVLDTSCDWGSIMHGNDPTTHKATQDLKEEQRRSEVKVKLSPLIFKSINRFMQQMFYRYLFGNNVLECTL